MNDNRTENLNMKFIERCNHGSGLFGAARHRMDSITAVVSKLVVYKGADTEAWNFHECKTPTALRFFIVCESKIFRTNLRRVCSGSNSSI